MSMGESREQTIERISMDLAPTPVLKVEPPRNSPGTALLRTVPLATQQRFLNTAPSSSVSHSTANSGLNKQGGVQRVEGISGMAPTAVINRLTTIPVQPANTSTYHVPRGAAAVANIAVPRSSLATPIVRGNSTLQTIGVTTSTNQAGYIRTSAPVATGVRGSTSWLSTSQPSRHPHNNSFAQNRMTVNTRMPGATVSTRPVLLQAAPPHKQIQPVTQQVHLTEKKFVHKSGLMRPGSQPMQSAGGRGLGVNRLAPPLRPVVSLHPTAVLVSAPATIQLQGAPSTIAISTRPVSVLTSGVRVTSAPGPAVAVSKVYCQAPEPSVYIQTTHKPTQVPVAAGNMVSLANPQYNLPQNSFYDNRMTFTAVQQQARPTTTPVQGIVSAGQPVRFNPVMVVDPVHPYVPSESSQVTQTMEGCNNAVSQPGLHIKQNASPRPSILRKRDTEGTPGKAAKNLNPLFGTLTVSTPSSPPSPKRPESRGGGGGQSSGGSTTISATSSPGLGADSPPLPLLPLKPLSEIIEEDRPMEMSPRKKPRKQQLTSNQTQKAKFSDDEMEFIPSEKLKKKSKESVAYEGLVTVGVKPVYKRPMMSLLKSYRPTWKARHHHFMRYTDVKAKEEKRATVADLAAQKNVLQKLNGWKICHLGDNMTDIANLEMDVFDRLTAMLKVLEKRSGKDGDINRVNELIKGNIQRSKVITDQLQEAKCQVMKLFEDHKCQVTEILTRFSSRRSGKKRERV